MPERVQSLRSSVTGQRPAAGSRQVGELYMNFADRQLGLIDAVKAPIDLVAVRYFSATAVYAAGDFVVQAGTGYRAKAAVPAGAFNPAQWDTIATSIDLSSKENTIAPGSVAQYWRGDKTWQTLDKAAVGLSNVDNTSDANKPVSTATAAAIAADITPWAEITGKPSTFPPTLPIAESDVTNLVADLAAKAPLASPTFTGDPKAPTPAAADNDTSIATTAFVKTAVAAIGGSTAQASNRIVNGAMQISQENGFDVAVPGNAAYTCDQWYQSLATGGVPSSVVYDTDPAGNYLRMHAQGTPDTAVAAGDFVTFTQRIEGIRIKDFLWGLAGARPAVLRFTARCGTVPSLVIAASVRNAGVTRSFVKHVTLTNAWQDFVVPIPGCTDGAWPTDNTSAYLVSFAMMTGANWLGAAQDAWLATNSLAAAGIGNIMAVANTFVDIKNVGLHLDPNNTGLAPPWQMPDEAAEFWACARYFYRANAVGSTGSNLYSTAAASMNAGVVVFPAPMRNTPAAAVITQPTYTNCSAAAAFAVGDVMSAGLRVTVTATGFYRALNGVYDFNARM